MYCALQSIVSALALGILAAAPAGPRLPVGLPPVPWPAGNPYSPAKWELGRTLFFDRRLSRDGTVSCASCHNPRFAFTDRKPTATGIAGRRGARNTPTVINQAYTQAQDWDGHAPSLEEQALGPLTNPLEMDSTPDGVAASLRSIRGYGPLFSAAFGNPEIDIGRFTQAIATFERTIVSGSSAYDRFKAGDHRAMSASQIRGTMVFYGKGRCDHCHNGLNLNTNGGSLEAPYVAEYHNLGVGMDRPKPDPGRFAITKNPRDWGAFKTPTLREIARTGPYMHDGSLKTLEQVVDFYNRGGLPNPRLDPEMRPLGLTAREKSDLVNFLKALSGEGWQQMGPPAAFPR